MNRLKNPNRLLRKSLSATVLLIAALAMNGCADKFDKDTVRTDIGVACEGGQNIIVTPPYNPEETNNTPYSPDHPQASIDNQGRVDEGDFEFIVGCETGKMEISVIEKDESFTDKSDLDAIVTVITEDLSGSRDPVGYASKQDSFIDHADGDSLAYVSLDDADSIQTLSVRKNGSNVVTDIDLG